MASLESCAQIILNAMYEKKRAYWKRQRAKRDPVKVRAQARARYARLRESERVRLNSYYPKHREKRLAAVKAWSAANPGRHRAYSLKYHYGMTPKDYLDKFNEQSGLCAVCGDDQPLCVDHVHGSKPCVVRGLLCTNCNTALGLLKESVTVIESLKRYIQKYGS
jgi:hypothetical protein